METGAVFYSRISSSARYSRIQSVIYVPKCVPVPRSISLARSTQQHCTPTLQIHTFTFLHCWTSIDSWQWGNYCHDTLHLYLSVRLTVSYISCQRLSDYFFNEFLQESSTNFDEKLITDIYYILVLYVTFLYTNNCLNLQ